MADKVPDRAITPEELSTHDNVKSAWIAVGGRVFDITEFIRTHPGMNGAGGATSTIVAIMNAVGKDCTDDFTAIHSQLAWKQLAEFCIGRLEPGSGTSCATTSPDGAVQWTGFDADEVRAVVSTNVEEGRRRHFEAEGRGSEGSAAPDGKGNTPNKPQEKGSQGRWWWRWGRGGAARENRKASVGTLDKGHSQHGGGLPLDASALPGKATVAASSHQQSAHQAFVPKQEPGSNAHSTQVAEAALSLPRPTDDLGQSAALAVNGPAAVSTTCGDPDLPNVSAAELARHSSQESAWVAVNGLVYDITDLLKQGALGSMASAMLDLGTDCTNQFAYIPALQSPLLQHCCIGQLR